MTSPLPLGADVPEDPAVAQIVGHYRDLLGARLSAQVGVAAADIVPSGEPSNPLGILVADEMLALLRTQNGLSVDCFITNDGGLRAPIYAGAIQLKHVYEVMPFDNELVVIEMDGATLQMVANLIAKKNGEPEAGLRMAIDPSAGEASDVQVGGVPLDPAKIYHVGTTDYLADSGWLSALVSKLPTNHTSILMRDAIIQQLRARPAGSPPLAPPMDDRIRLKPGATLLRSGPPHPASAGASPPSTAPSAPGAKP